MKKHRAVFATLFVLLPLAFAQEPAVPEAAPPKVAKGTQCLWTATQGDKTIHLLGSVHLTMEGMLPLPKAMNEAIAACDAAMFETDIRALKAPVTQLRMMALTMYRDGTDLEDHLPKDVYVDFLKYMNRNKLPAGMTKMKPWALATSVITILELQKDGGFDIAGGGIDSHVEKRITKAGKKTIPLEDLAFYTKLFNGLTDEEQTAMLKAALRDADKAVKQTKELIGHWKTGNAEHLEALLKEGMKDQKAMEKKLLLDRNQDWIPKIEKASETHDTLLVVVGAGHLVGPGSVCELLTEKGWAVVQK